MPAKKDSGSKWIDADDAPLLTEAFFKEAEVFEGDRFIRRGPGRPRIANPKEPVQIRLDADVLAALRGHGPGWQTRVNGILRTALRLNESS